MVKIRLRRTGTKGRPFYRIVVAESTAGRNGSFIENIGTYDPVAKPKHLDVNEDRALHWLMEGAQPTETTAYLLNKSGVLPRFFEQRPTQKAKYSFLDKRTAAVSVPTAVDTPVAREPEPTPEPEPEATPEPEAEAPATNEAE